MSDDMLEEDALQIQEKLGCWYQMMRCMGWTASKEKRMIHLSG